MTQGKYHKMSSTSPQSIMTLNLQGPQVSSQDKKIPVAYRGGVWVVQTPPLPEIPNDLQNHAKLNPIVKTVKNC